MFQNRASDDYEAGNSQWKIGVNAAWMWPLGQTPFKDAFWTSKKSCPRFIYMVESRPELESVVVALAAGPTGWGDLIGQTNRSLLMRCCNENGLILKPSKPASAVDDVFQHVIMWIGVHFLHDENVWIGCSLTHLPLNKRPPFCRRYFQRYILKWKVLYFD